MNLIEAVRHHCTDVAPALLELHFRRLPPSYFEVYSAADIARHLRLLSRMTPPHPVEVEFRPLTGGTLEVLVVGGDLSGALACITAALASDGFTLEDVHVAPYLRPEIHEEEPSYFVVRLLISGRLRGQATTEVAVRLRERLRTAFGLLAQGLFREAQVAAVDPALARTDAGRSTPYQSSPSALEVQEGTVLGGDFRLQQRLAVGGMSEVYQATQLSLNRTVAVKLLRQAGPADDDLRTRFEQECLVLGRFSCPYIVPILAAGTVVGQGNGLLGWMAMEFMAGGDLGRWVGRQGPPPLALGLRWFRQALQGLAYAHEHGILHRDLKPHNLLLTKPGPLGTGLGGDLKVSDFGLLKQVQSSAEGLTPRTAIVGTPHYMAPEQAQGETLDERSDIFSLGTTFFHVFSGRLPFISSSPTAVLVQIMQEDAPLLTEVVPQAPRPLALILRRMMARLREERYQDVGVILAEVASYERRGLLLCAESGRVAPVVPAESGDGAETRSYQIPRGEQDDVVI